LYRQQDYGFGTSGGAHTLAAGHAPPLFTVTMPFGRADPVAAARRFDARVDLGTDIGSARWWRGLATCIALITTSCLLAPPLRPLPAMTGHLQSTAVWEQSRALAIAPLAFGGDTGRRMAATDAVQRLAQAPERPTLDLLATIGQGDGFVHALERAGVASHEAARVAAMTAAAADPAAIAPGTILTLTLGRRAVPTMPRPVEALSFRARFDLKLAFVRSGAGLVMQRLPIAIDSSPLRVTGRVGDGVYLGATAAGAPSDAVQDYIRAIASRVELGALDPDARFDMVIERQRAATGDVKFGKLLYIGMTQGGRTTQMIQWTIDGRTEWYDTAGVGARRAGFSAPVAGRRTSGFGMRFHPLLGYTRMHQGTDYGAAYGAPIHAVTDGTVAYAGWHGGHGNMVRLAHAGALGTGYAHMSRIAVAPGARVTQGQVIGYVGSTGLSTGPHLHFEVYRNGTPVSPESVSFATSSLLEGSELAAFRARLAAVTSVAIAGR
jgi:murein DD-endopeptidase MepM/ murein hydrolase activator NlpD